MFGDWHVFLAVLRHGCPDGDALQRLSAAVRAERERAGDAQGSRRHVAQPELRRAALIPAPLLRSLHCTGDTARAEGLGRDISLNPHGARRQASEPHRSSGWL